MPIKNIFARQIFDSCGIPTVEVDLTTDLGLFRAAVPSGANAGNNEALELRDEDKTNYHGRSVLRAIENINTVIAPELMRQNLEVTQQSEIDDFMIQLDGTDNKSKLGVNAILPVSLATAKAAAAKRGIPLYRHLADLAGNKDIILPVPAFNVISGGTHAGNKLPIQEFMILPTGANSFKEAMKMGCEVYQQMKNAIKTKYGVDSTNVGNRGAFCPKIKAGKDALVIIRNAIKKTGYMGRFDIAIDASGTSFYKKGKYDMDFKNPKSDKKKFVTPEKLMASYMTFIKDFPVVSIEDPFFIGDAKSWAAFTEKSNIQVVGDDLILTNPKLIEEAIDKKTCNCFLLKLNQLGTVTETIEAHLLAKANGWGTLVSDRLGETEDTFIADLCVGLSTGQIKTGAPCRSDRLVKYNQLLRIEEELGLRAKYAGKAFRRPS